MATTDFPGLYDRGFGHWLETHRPATERLTGHASERWQRRPGREMRSNVLRAETDPKAVHRPHHSPRAA